MPETGRHVPCPEHVIEIEIVVVVVVVIVIVIVTPAGRCT